MDKYSSSFCTSWTNIPLHSAPHGQIFPFILHLMDKYSSSFCTLWTNIPLHSALHGQIFLFILHLVDKYALHSEPHKQFFFSRYSWDDPERHELKSRLWLFFSPFLFPLKERGKKKGEWIAKIVILSHAFLDHLFLNIFIFSKELFQSEFQCSIFVMLISLITEQNTSYSYLFLF